MGYLKIHNCTFRVHKPLMKMLSAVFNIGSYKISMNSLKKWPLLWVQAQTSCFKLYAVKAWLV